MPSVREKIAVLAECASDRREFYREWYSQHGFADTVTGFAAEISRSAKMGAEPLAVDTISRHAEFLDQFINPALLSPAAKSFAGGFGGAASVVSSVILGLPDFLRGVLSGDIGLRQIVGGALDALLEANALILSYAGGDAPPDPYERAFEASQKLGAAVMVLYGAKSAASGMMGLIRSAAKNAARAATPTPMLATTCGGLLAEGSLAMIEGSSAYTAAMNGAGGFFAMSVSALEAGGGAFDALQEALNKYRKLSDRQLLMRAKTLKRLGPKQGNRPVLMKELQDEQALGKRGGRTLRGGPNLTLDQKRAFVQVLIERSMQKDALRLMAEWELAEFNRAYVRRNFVKDGMKVRTIEHSSEIASRVYSSLDDAALSRMGETVAELLRRNAARLAYASKLHNPANAQLSETIGNLGETRSLAETLKLSRIEELVAEMNRRGFSDDAFILERLIKAGDS